MSFASITSLIIVIITDSYLHQLLVNWCQSRQKKVFDKRGKVDIHFSIFISFKLNWFHLHSLIYVHSCRVDIKKDSEGIRPNPNARRETCRIHLHSICKIISILLIPAINAWQWRKFLYISCELPLCLSMEKFRFWRKWNLNEIWNLLNSSENITLALKLDRKFHKIFNTSIHGFQLFQRPKKSFLWFRKH